MSSMRLDWTYPACSRVNSPVSVSSKCAFQKWVLKAIHVFWVGGRQPQNLMDSRNFPFLLMVFYAFNIGLSQ